MNERDKELANVIYGSQWTTQDLHFAALIRADEREACAKVCDEQAGSEYWEGANACARNIRARGNT